MTRARSIIFLGIIAIACAIVVGVQAWRATDSASRQTAAKTRLSEVTGQVTRIAQLRDKSATAEVGARPREDLLSRASAVLADAGLPTARLTDLTPQADTPLPAVPGRPQYHRQTVRLTLSPVTPRELGEFLDRWRRTERAWTPTRIELAGAAEPGAFQALVHVSATYVSGDQP